MNNQSEVLDDSDSVIGADASRLARFLQIFLLCAGSLVLIAVIALLLHWPIVAFFLLIVVVCLPGVLTTPSMLQMARANRQDSVRKPSSGELLSAWWSESVAVAKVYLWRQSFGWHIRSDSRSPSASLESASGSAIVFVHGFVCNRGLWNPWMARLDQLGVPYVSVNLEPLFGSISDYAAIIESAVRKAQQLAPGKPLLVGHSMGGLASRAWLLTQTGANQRVCAVVTIGSPHRGTLLANGSKTTNGRQMMVGSRWLAELELQERQKRPSGTYQQFLCWYTNTDNIVFPASTALLEGADNRLIPGIGHLALNYHPRVMNETIALARSTE